MGLDLLSRIQSSKIGSDERSPVAALEVEFLEANPLHQLSEDTSTGHLSKAWEGEVACIFVRLHNIGVNRWIPFRFGCSDQPKPGIDGATTSNAICNDS